jgi:hypothetical protein
MSTYKNVYVNKTLGKNIFGQDVAERNRIGYCYCKTHPGYITKAILKEKKCIENKCYFFKKCENAHYWVEKEKIKQKRKEGKLLKKEIENNENLILTEIRDATLHVDGFAALSVNEENGIYIVRCVYVYRETESFKNRILNIVLNIDKIAEFDIKTVYIENTFYKKKAIYDKVRAEY